MPDDMISEVLLECAAQPSQGISHLESEPEPPAVPQTILGSHGWTDEKEANMETRGAKGSACFSKGKRSCTFSDVDDKVFYKDEVTPGEGFDEEDYLADLMQGEIGETSAVSVTTSSSGTAPDWAQNHGSAANWSIDT